MCVITCRTSIFENLHTHRGPHTPGLAPVRCVCVLGGMTLQVLQVYVYVCVNQLYCWCAFGALLWLNFRSPTRLQCNASFKQIQIFSGNMVFIERYVYKYSSGVWNYVIMPSPLIGRGIKRWCCLTSVWCLSCLTSVMYSGLTREQRGLGRLKLAQR